MSPNKRVQTMTCHLQCGVLQITTTNFLAKTGTEFHLKKSFWKIYIHCSVTFCVRTTI